MIRVFAVLTGIVVAVAVRDAIKTWRWLKEKK